jgi:NTE family protein
MGKKLGIAFGGRGAEGLVCAAYVKAMEEMDIKPDIVSGTGIGGVIAAMYASGMSYQDMANFIKEINFPGAKRPINVTKLRDEKHGILDDMGLEEYFKMAAPIKVFDRLYFTLKIVAADLDTGSEIIFEKGDVSRAVRAGVSVPGIFSPHEADGLRYIDGTCVNPVPFDIIRNDCDILVGIAPEINEEMNQKSNTVFSAMTGAYNAAKKTIFLEKQKECKVDYMQNILVDGFTMFDFAYYSEIVSQAQDNADNFIMELKKVLNESK